MCRLLAHGEARRVLIIGGGDGGVLRRVLEHGTVERAVMVEIDGEVIQLVREHMPASPGGAWSDPRAEVIVGDGLKYLAESPDGAFDVIIVDSTDPVGVAETLFTEHSTRIAPAPSVRTGIVANQSGVPFMQSRELAETKPPPRKGFPARDGLCRRGPDLCRRVHGPGIRGQAARPRRACRTGVLRAARPGGRASSDAPDYWSPEVHAAAFQLPPYISAPPRLELSASARSCSLQIGVPPTPDNRIRPRTKAAGSNTLRKIHHQPAAHGLAQAAPATSARNSFHSVTNTSASAPDAAS